MSSWWDRHLGGPQRPSAPSQRDSYPPTTQTPLRGSQTPPSAIRNPYRNFNEDEESEGPDIGMQAALAQGDDYRPKTGRAASIQDADPDGNRACPECGSNLYFSRRQGIRRGPPPAPICEACGYNGLFEQTGSILSSMTTRTVGPVHNARQDDASIHGGLDYSTPFTHLR